MAVDSGDKIKLFKFIQKTYHGIGIFSPKSNQIPSSINSKNWLNLFCHMEFLISSIAYLLFEANSMIEYGLAFYICTTVLTSLIFYLIPLGESENILNFIQNCEQFINDKSEYKHLYSWLHSEALKKTKLSG